MTAQSHDGQHAAPGRVLHWAVQYDWLVWLFTLGRERRFRERMLRLAQVQPGERLLDVGCGTGSLALLAKERTGATGRVAGVDASPAMVDRARRKARRAGADIEFAVAPAQHLPFADGAFDVVLSTLMLHHLDPEGRRLLAAEARRVLRPGGRFLAVDFAPPADGKRGGIAGLHRHGHSSAQEMTAEIASGELTVAAAGPVGTRNLHFVLATPTPADADRLAASIAPLIPSPPGEHRRPRHGPIALGVAAAALLALHLVAGSTLIDALDGAGSMPLWLVIGSLGLLAALKLGVIASRHRRARAAPTVIDTACRAHSHSIVPGGFDV